MNRINLCGQWNLTGGEFQNIKAEVPGCVHTDLLNADKICDPFFRDNEKNLMWIGETDWEYSRTFEVQSNILKNKKVILRCEGLDTLAVININGREVASTDNMFRTWEFDVKDYLKAGENNISVLFKSTIPYINKKNEERWLWMSGINHHRVEGSNQIRKMQCNYGWDWGPMCVTCGIWRNIEILALSHSRINSVQVLQEHGENDVDLEFEVELDKISEGSAQLKISVFFDGNEELSIESEGEGSLVKGFGTLTNPKLWWPNNLGEQHLYEVVVKLIEGNEEIDSDRQTIGLRTLRLDRHPDRWGESFQFVVNGVPFFAKGANWIPADTFVTRTSDEFYEKLIKDTADANMNFLRVWGGGIYEQDIFYELCDRYGICVWQDFMFACSAYPAHDEDFMNNVKKEAIDNVKRLSSHPSIALWCGNNELEQISPCININGSDGAMTWEEYKNLFDKLLPQVVEKYSPNTDYWPSSPHTPGEDRENWANPTAGDAHLWSVWHGREPFEWYRTCEHRFNSEFGFQSFPEPKVVEEYTLPKDRNITSYVMEYHQRSGIGNDAIIQYMLSWFKLPSTFENLLYLSQILQGLAMKYAVEHWRRKMPQGMGTIYWQLNDCWPAPSWASMDYKGNWKALQYIAKKFYAPLLISGVEDIDKGSVELHLTNDLLEDMQGEVTWMLIDIEGDVIAENSSEACVRANSTNIVTILDLKQYVERIGSRNCMLYISFSQNGDVISDNMVLFSRPKHIEFSEPEFRVEINKIDSGVFEVYLETKKPALWVWPEIEGEEADYSGRFFDMIPQKRKKVVVKTEKDLDLEKFKEKIKIFSLIDTYR